MRFDPKSIDSWAVRWMIVRALLMPIAAWATAGFVLIATMSGASGSLIAGTAFAFWASVLVGRKRLRSSRLKPLLANHRKPPKVGHLALEEFAVRPFPESHVREDRQHPEYDKHLSDLLGSRRLVLVCGERLTGRSRLVFGTLQRDFSHFRVLQPASNAVAAGTPTLTNLLTSPALSVGGRYVLWLDNVASMMAAGFDPNVLDAWLAAGLNRVAVGTITPYERDQAIALGTWQGMAIERSATFTVHPPWPTSTATFERYRTIAQNDRHGRALIETTAVCRLVGLRELTEDRMLSVVTQLEGKRVKSGTLDLCLAGPAPPLRLVGSIMVVHPTVLTALEKDLDRMLTPRLVQALLKHATATDQLTLGLRLALRGRFDEAHHALESAETEAEPGLRLAIERARADVVRRAAGEPEPMDDLLYLQGMSEAQREAAEGLKDLPDEPDKHFDPQLPPPSERRSARFYRLTLYRSLARVAALFAIDTAAIATASFVALTIREAVTNGPPSDIHFALVKLIVAGALVTAVIAVSLGLYRPNAPRARIRLIVATMAVVSTVAAATFFVFSLDLGSFGALAAFFFAASAADWVLRSAYDGISRSWVRKHWLQPRVLLFGNADEARSHASNMSPSSGRPVQAVAFLSQKKNGDPFCLGDASDLERLLHVLHIAELTIVDQRLGPEARTKLIERAHRCAVNVSFLPTEHEIAAGTVGRLGSLGLVRVPVRLIAPEAVELKRLVDYIMVMFTLPFWGPFLLAYAVHGVWCRKGQPVIIPSAHMGLGGSSYPLLRLRTRRRVPGKIIPDEASSRLEDLVEKYGLDELPQVINVLRGEMSLVGPPVLTATEAAPDGNSARQRVLRARPGMTGRWQVVWPYAPSVSELYVMEADYLRRWRLSHDFELLLKTPAAIIRRRGALSATELKRRRNDATLGPH